MVNFTKRLFPFVILFFALLSTSQSQAQSYYYGREKNIRLGLAINPNVGWLRYENDQEGSAKLGFSYGLVADLGFAKNYYFSTGLLINTINSRVEPAFRSVENNDPAIPKYKDLSLKYVDVPLSIKLKSTPNEFGRFYGQFGFTAGVKVSSKEQLENKNKETTSADLFRLGLQIGGGAEWKIGNDMAVMTGLTFNNGFTRTMKDGSPKSSFVALNLGLLF
ncbi:porin family protein [Sphingobacterium yanglingense]|uniref:Outer membrane protein with beta-barrel domain n=1 Tax=Sphingobacterium yanglingense TaxID=1437280 RepID=A0A4R6WCS5_9SPHI|nr:porin family protein [Sphingobacterium yanglingense]TDQ75748.1 outer membrane protein with beta-barrel domain [Sphingobacterium yanglingense]